MYNYAYLKVCKKSFFLTLKGEVVCFCNKLPNLYEN